MLILWTVLLFLVVLTTVGLVMYYCGIKKLVRLIFILALLSTILLGFMPAMSGWVAMADVLLLHISFLMVFGILLLGICAVKLDQIYHVLSRHILKHLVLDDATEEEREKRETKG